MRQGSLIIVNWNTGDLLATCLASIAGLPDSDRIRHVVVVDNASADTSVAKAREIARTHGYVILEQGINHGFAKANAIGLSYIQSHGGSGDDIFLYARKTLGGLQSLLLTVNISRTPCLTYPQQP